MDELARASDPKLSEWRYELPASQEASGLAFISPAATGANEQGWAHEGPPRPRFSTPRKEVALEDCENDFVDSTTPFPVACSINGKSFFCYGF